ncbi:hypothetical protein RMSM_06213 [Rhodopirellula maiorica SM1]|uniref:Uncharacterized protein n=1 Tax=Rhodopirellula maiorica SM1 TaxID=1265738 RepID=M5RBW2_9BACT|nr:hypothetical protein RMSM_06213 [Rhodopirellula maiorica SM1]
MPFAFRLNQQAAGVKAANFRKDSCLSASIAIIPQWNDHALP